MLSRFFEDSACCVQEIADVEKSVAHAVSNDVQNRCTRSEQDPLQAAALKAAAAVRKTNRLLQMFRAGQSVALADCRFPS